MSSIVFVLDRGLNNGGGFFACFFFLCNAYLRAEDEKKSFCLSHESWTYTHNKGWHDYFTTLTTVDAVPPGSIVTRHMSLSEQRTFPLFRYSECIQRIFRLKPDLIARANAILASLGTFTGLFVRRGDKHRECPDTRLETLLPSIPDDIPLFVQTDDYSVIEELKAFRPSQKIVSTVPTTKRGSFHSTQFYKECRREKKSRPWDQKTPEEIRTETEEMLIGLYICAQAPRCLTDSTSNVGRFLALWSPTTVVMYPNDRHVDLTLCAHPAWTITETYMS